MARKRLSDFLREEAQKSLDVPATPDPQSPAVEPEQPPQTVRKTRTASPKQTGAKKGEQAMAPVKAPPAPTPNGVSAAHTKLEATIAELKTALEEAKLREEVLQHQVESLQADLTVAQETLGKLQKEHYHAAQARDELEEARKVILQLSELNANLNEQLKTAKSSVVKPAAQPVSAAVQAPARPPAHDTNRMITPDMHSQVELRRMLQHPTAPGSPPSTAMTNEEIGWVD